MSYPQPCSRCGWYSCSGYHLTPIQIILRVLAVVGVIALFAWGLVAANNQANDAWNHRNLDPRIGPVLFYPNGQEWKQCDGPNLVYHTTGGRGNDGVSAISESPECR